MIRLGCGLMGALCMASVVSAQTPRLFVVPRGTNPVSTAPGIPVEIEVIGGSLLILDIYVEIDGGSLAVSGMQFEMPCEVIPAIGNPMTYVSDSVVSDGFDMAGSCDANWVDQRAAGSCPTDRPGALAAGPLGSPCTLSTPELVGSITYRVPTTVPSPNLFSVEPTLAILTNQNQQPIANLQVDGVEVSICEACPAIPAVSDWGMVVFFLTVICAASLVLRRGQFVAIVQSSWEQKHRSEELIRHRPRT